MSRAIRMRRPDVVAWLVLALAAGSCADRPRPSARILEHELSIDLRADGSAAIRQRASVELSPDADAFVLPMPDARVDGVADVVATMDGRRVGDGEGEGVVSLDIRADRIAWRFPPQAPGPHEFTLDYLAHGVMGLRGARGFFIWPAVPAGTGPVADARVRLRLPEAAIPVSGPSIVDEDWQVRREGHVTVMRGTGEGGVHLPLVSVELVLDDLTVTEPRWQVTRDRGRQLAPAFVAAGLFLCVVGAGVLWMVRLQYATTLAGDSRPLPAVDPALAELASRRPSMRGVGRAEASALVAAGLVDQDRLLVASGLRIAAAVVVLIAAGSAAALWPAIGRFGGSVLAIPAGLLAVAVMFWLAGMRFSALTAAGEQMRRSAAGAGRL